MLFRYVLYSLGRFGLFTITYALKALLGNTRLNLRPGFFGQCHQFLSFVEVVKKSLGYAFRPNLRTHKGTSQHRTGHILPTTVKGHAG